MFFPNEKILVYEACLKEVKNKNFDGDLIKLLKTKLTFKLTRSKILLYFSELEKVKLKFEQGDYRHPVRVLNKLIIFNMTEDLYDNEKYKKYKNG